MPTPLASRGCSDGDDDDGNGGDEDGDDSGGDGDDSGGDGDGGGGVATAAVATAMAMVAMAVVATAAVSQYKTQPAEGDAKTTKLAAVWLPYTATSSKALSRVPRASDVFGEM